ncbi:hypothetical protein F4777DRAFT_557995 [Nemania sp. FL0916]|nr:hypothetical protein F4777DRAFT_557995 [Nemania sp. FL0916]
MGQNVSQSASQSQPDEERRELSDNASGSSDDGHYPIPSDQPVFSSQAYSSANPTLPPPLPLPLPWQSPRTAHSSSPASRLHSSPTISVTSSSRPAHPAHSSSPSPACDASMSSAARLNAHDDLPPRPRKSRRENELKNRTKDALEKSAKKRKRTHSGDIVTEEPEAHIEELAKDENTMSNKRKKRSKRAVAETPNKGAKRRKKAHRSTSSIVTAAHNDPTEDNSIKQADLPDNSSSDHDSLAEQPSSSRKLKHLADASRPELELEANRTVSNANAGTQARTSLSINTPEDDDPFDTQLPENQDTGHRGKGGNSIGTVSGGVDSVQDGAETTSSRIDSTVYSQDHTQIPSSARPPTSENGPRPQRSGTFKTSTGQKRVAKPDFFSRIANKADKGVDSPSQLTAAELRKGNQAPQANEIPALVDESPAGRPLAKGKAERRKIPSTPGGGDSATTPAAGSAVRIQTLKASVTPSKAPSASESANLARAVEQYRDDHNMTQQQVNELLHSNPKHGASKTDELWELLTASCPSRSRRQVIDMARRKFHNFVARGTWKPDEDHELRQLYDQYGTKYTLIAQLINRHPEDVRDRIRNYIVCGDKQRKIRWTKQETDRLVALVQEALNEIRQQRAKKGLHHGDPVEGDIDWQLVSQGMGRTRSRLQCIYKWKAINAQRDSSAPDGKTISTKEVIEQARKTAISMSYLDRSLIIEGILNTGAHRDSRIAWLQVHKQLEYQWTMPALMIVWSRLKRDVTGWQSASVKELCTFLLQKFEKTHTLEYPSTAINDDVEYHEIAYMIEKGRKHHMTPKGAALTAKSSIGEEENDEDEAETLTFDSSAQISQETPRRPSHGQRRRSVDLSIGNTCEEEQAVEDSEPEAATPSIRERTRTRNLSKAQYVQEAESDAQSSDTDASQVSSIPAR